MSLNILCIKADYSHDASAWGRRIFDTDEIDIPLQAEVHSKLYVQKEDLELEDVLIDFMTRDREKLKELGLWDVIYDKGEIKGQVLLNQMGFYYLYTDVNESLKLYVRMLNFLFPLKKSIVCK